MGTKVLDLNDGHYAKTMAAVEVASIAEAQRFELQLDTGYGVDPFENGSAYVLYGHADEDGYRQPLGEYADPVLAVFDMGLVDLDKVEWIAKAIPVLVAHKTSTAANAPADAAKLN
jgi:hypothetical protein